MPPSGSGAPGASVNNAAACGTEAERRNLSQISFGSRPEDNRPRSTGGTPGLPESSQPACKSPRLPWIRPATLPGTCTWHAVSAHQRECCPFRTKGLPSGSLSSPRQPLCRPPHRSAHLNLFYLRVSREQSMISNLSVQAKTLGRSHQRRKQ